jgi:predicted transposase YdaD
MITFNSDLPLKRLFAHRAADLLALVGDAGATILGGQSIELPSVARRLDYVLTLEHHGATYMRHLEFQTDAAAPDVAERCFEYNTRLFLHTKLPVVTTVICLRPPGPRGRPVFHVRLRRRVLHRWRFEWLKLWELDAHQALTGGPGLAVLVPYMKNESLALIGEAARRILDAASPAQQPDLLAALNIFAGQRYTAKELSRIVGRERMMESSVWQEAVAIGQARGMALGRVEGKAEGRVEGKVEGEREACLALVAEFHPELLDSLRPVVERCRDAARLKAWLVQIPRLSPEALVRLIAQPA